MTKNGGQGTVRKAVLCPLGFLRGKFAINGAKPLDKNMGFVLK